MDNDLKTLKFPIGTVQRGSPKVPSKEQEVGVLCGHGTPSYLQSERSFLFSEVHFRTGTPGLSLLQLSSDLGETFPPEWR